MSFNNILFEVDSDGIALITINRPEKLNALNRDVLKELEQAITRIETDSAIRALIVTGAGEKSFVAGADIQELSAVSPIEAEGLSRRGQKLFRRIEMLRKPSVAAINGFALGGGLELAMCCTIRAGAPNAKLGQPEVKLGLVAGYGATQRLPRLVGRGYAMEMLVSGDPIDIAEAFRIRLVNYVTPQSDLLPFCRRWLRKVLANGPVAVALTMQAVDVGFDAGMEAGLRFEAAAFALSAASDDRAEGTRAFLEKRKAAFAGK